MTKPIWSSIRYEAQRWDSIEQLWMLATGCSTFGLRQAVDPAGRNAAALAMFARSFR